MDGGEGHLMYPLKSYEKSSFVDENAIIHKLREPSDVFDNPKYTPENKMLKISRTLYIEFQVPSYCVSLLMFL